MAEAVCLAMRLGSTTVLARLLLPEHFGLTAMILAITAIVERFKDFGLSDAVIQRQRVTQEQLSTLFWINVAIGTAFACLFALLCQPLANWYGDRRVANVAIALACTFLFGGMTIQHQALLRRHMRFTRLACIQVTATIAGIAVAVYLAWQGYQYWALVWKEIAGSAVTMVGVWTLCSWRPNLTIRRTGIDALLRFGRDLTVFNMAYFVSRSLDQILLGKLWGPTAVGLYKQAYQLIAMLVNQLQHPFACVGVSALSRLQADPEKYGHYYTKYLSLLLFVSMPTAVYFAVFSEEIVRIILGDQWRESASLVSALAVGAFIHPVNESVGLVLMTSGQTSRFRRWGIMNATCIGVAVCAALPWGARGVAVAYSVATYVIFIISLVWYLQDTPVSWRIVGKTMQAPAFCSLLMGGIVAISANGNTWLSGPSGVPVSLCLAGVAYGSMWLLLPDGRQQLAEYLRYTCQAFGQEMLSRRSGSG